MDWTVLIKKFKQNKTIYKFKDSAYFSFGCDIKIESFNFIKGVYFDEKGKNGADRDEKTFETITSQVALIDGIRKNWVKLQKNGEHFSFWQNIWNIRSTKSKTQLKWYQEYRRKQDQWDLRIIQDNKRKDEFIINAQFRLFKPPVLYQRYTLKQKYQNKKLEFFHPYNW